MFVMGAAALWASFGLFAKVLYARGFTPFELASVRAAVGMVAAGLLTLRHPARLRLDRRGLLFFAGYGVVGFGLFETLYFLALERTSVAIAVTLLYTAPAFVLLASRVLWHEPVPRWKLLALLMVLAGVLLVSGAVGAIAHGEAHLGWSALLIGLGAGAGYAGYTLMSKVATHRFTSEAALFWSFFFAALALALVAPPIEPLLRRRDSVLLLLALGVVPTLLPYALYLAGLRRMRASTAAMLACLEPVMAALLALVVLGEPLGGTAAAGIALIVGAALLLTRERREPVASAPPAARQRD